MNEGENKRSKKIYKRGDRVTFRLPIKGGYSNDVINLLNEANQADKLNHELIKALELYTKYKTYNEASMSDVEKKFIIQQKENENPETEKRTHYEPANEAEEVFSNNHEDEEIILNRRSFKISKNDQETNNHKIIQVETWQGEIIQDEIADEIFTSNKEINTNIKQDKGSMSNAFSSLRRRK